MKKLLTGLFIIVFCLTIVSPVFAGFPAPPHHPHHFPYWGGIGLGILAGTIAANLLFRPSPPEAVYVSPPRPMVVQPVPAPMALPRVYGSNQPPATPDSEISVTSQLLNVRSGPGLNFSVLSQVTQGNMLVIKGSAPDWFYVQLPDGTFGWVMARFTDRASLPASG